MDFLSDFDEKILGNFIYNFTANFHENTCKNNELYNK